MTAKRFVLVGALSLALSACGGLDGLIGPKDAGSTYMVRPVPAPAPAGGAKVNWALAVLHPDVPGALDVERVALSQPDGTTDYYANAAYPDRLSATVQHALVDGFEASGRIDAVAREEESLHADYNLLVEVKDFSAHYAVADGIPTVTVTLMAKLITAHGRRLIASKEFTQTGTASVNSAAAAVAALRQALGAAVTAAVDWTLNAVPPTPPGQTASDGRPARELVKDVSRRSEKASGD